ncbi:DUF664 domain-containing protein [Kribbella sp. NPDC023855]
MAGSRRHLHSMLVHVRMETSRHTGQADTLREGSEGGIGMLPAPEPHPT